MLDMMKKNKICADDVNLKAIAEIKEKNSDFCADLLKIWDRFSDAFSDVAKVDMNSRDDKNDEILLNLLKDAADEILLSINDMMMLMLIATM